MAMSRTRQKLAKKAERILEDLVLPRAVRERLLVKVMDEDYREIETVSLGMLLYSNNPMRRMLGENILKQAEVRTLSRRTLVWMAVPVMVNREDWSVPCDHDR